ncbi:uncharacterized protein [Leptinotarsa decemlineata]|uniref:uncharacterized protein n=1 Tax=Leptinotarsa decemlineata TaxID=7539 RepID=UPI003D30D0D2
MFLKIIVFITYSLTLEVKCEGEYYWRPWTRDSPPEDAITARDNRGISYVVEAYAPNLGIFIGQAFVHQHQINVSAFHMNSTLIPQKSHALKVLCSGNKDKLAWYPTSSHVLRHELETSTVNAVVGGQNAQDDILYIGKYVDTSARTIHFGSICDSLLHLHYNHNNVNKIQYHYEILILNDKCNK